jgi:hypothetical protein
MFGHKPGTKIGGSAGAEDADAAIARSPYVVAQRRRLAGVLGNSPDEMTAGSAESDESAPAQRVESEPPATQSDRTGLPGPLKAGVESLSGMSMDHVRVHYNSPEPAPLRALAFAQGSEIHLAAHQESQLPHEAWHVVQQARARVKPTVQVGGVPVNNDPGLEAEADAMGARALAIGGTISRASRDRGSDPGGSGLMGLDAPPAQLQRGGAVVQRSSDGQDAGDEALARAVIQRGQDLIDRATQGIQGGVARVGFSNVATGHLGAVASDRKSISVVVDQNDGNGPQKWYITPSQRAALHQAAEQLGWDFLYHFQDVEFRGQFGASGDLVMGRFEEPVQLAATVTGALNIGAAKAPFVPNPNLANGTINYLGVNGSNVTTGVTGTSLNRQPQGTAVGATRPANWADFLAMCGAVNPFKQGHHMHQGLGGDGTNDNLAPFTASLNAFHYWRVESWVITQTDNPPSYDQFADYSAIPVYGGNANIANWAIAQFGGMGGAAQLAAMVGAGILAAAAVVGQAAPTAAEILLANAWITNYVNGAFPASINCSVRFIDYDPLNLTSTASGVQNVNITNDF